MAQPADGSAAFGRRGCRMVVRLRLYLVGSTGRQRLPGRRQNLRWLLPFAVTALPAGMAIYTALGSRWRA